MAWSCRSCHSGSAPERRCGDGEDSDALAFVPSSDRIAKKNFAPVDAREILDKVAALPLTRWNCRVGPGCEHIDPMAQDFHAAFGLNGSEDQRIATLDADGVTPVLRWSVMPLTGPNPQRPLSPSDLPGPPLSAETRQPLTFVGFTSARITLLTHTHEYAILWFTTDNTPI